MTSCLANSLHDNNTMRELFIDLRKVPTKMGTVGAMALSEMLKVNRSLTKLTLWNDKSLGETGARALINSLQYNNTLEHLELPERYRRKHFSEAELSEMDSRVTFVDKKTAKKKEKVHSDVTVPCGIDNIASPGLEYIIYACGEVVNWLCDVHTANL